MRILLIDPPGEQAGINAGLAYLSGALEAAGIDHLVLDMVNGDPSDANLLRIAERHRPEYFGLSIKTATYTSSVHVSKVLKSAFEHTPIIAGGPHVTLYGEELLAQVPQIDAAIAGDAEVSLPELPAKWDGKGDFPEINGLIFRSAGGTRCIPAELPMALDDLPFPSFDRFVGSKLLDHHYPLVTSRGCPHGCIYCSVGKVSGRKWRYRSPSSVVDELERARDKWGFPEFDVLDDTFTHNVERAGEICRLIIDRKLGMRWSCPNGIRADRVTPDLLEAMAVAGCHTVIFGVETGNPEIFTSLRKGEKLADIERAVHISKEIGLRVGGYFIIGLPGDTYEGTVASLDYAKTLGLDWAHFNILAPYPGTKVWDVIQKEGRFLDDWRTTRHFGTSPKPIFELEGYSASDMVKAYRTVHVRQGLYHLLLAPDISESRRRRAIRLLRLQHDRKGWLRDVARDARTLLAVPVTLAKTAAHEARRRLPASSPALKPQAKAKSAESMRILMVNDHGGAAGGTERYIRDISDELAGRNVKVAWAFDEAGDWEGMDFERYRVRGLWDPVPVSDMRRDIKAAARDFKPDLIHIHNVGPARIMDICAELAPTIRTVHDHNLTCPSMNRMWTCGRVCSLPAGWACIDKLLDGGCMVLGRRPLLLMSRLGHVLDGIDAARKMPRIITTTRFMASELIANGIDAGSVDVLPLYVEFPEDFNEPDDEIPLRILWAGRMVVPDKGPDLFLEALYHLKSEWTAVMAGTGPAEDFVRRKAVELELIDRLEFAGQLTPRRMELEYRKCHAVVFTSIWPEPFGYVGVEAAAHARPVVAFDVGAVGEWLVDGEGGDLVPRGRTRAMAIRIDRLAKDPALRKTMGLNHRQHAMERYAKGFHIEKLLQIYTESAGR